MARLPRYVLAGQPQHVIQRGNRRQAIFSEDADYRFYLEKLQRAWVLGDGRFKRKLQPRLRRRMAPKGRGGDHKSDAYRQKTTINRV